MNNKIKKNLIVKIKDILNKQIKNIKKEMNKAQEEANYHKGAMESRYDTFKEEAQALKAGLSRNLNELITMYDMVIKYEYEVSKNNISSYNVKLGSIVITNNIDKFDNEIEIIYFLLVNVGVNPLIIDDNKYILLNIQSPLGQSLLNKQVNDQIIFRENTIEIVEIS